MQVSTAVLKFMAEFVLNKTQRLTFDSSSPNGILLFRQVSKVRRADVGAIRLASCCWIHNRIRATTHPAFANLAWIVL
jgi:hypothetical protein